MRKRAHSSVGTELKTRILSLTTRIGRPGYYWQRLQRLITSPLPNYGFPKPNPTLDTAADSVKQPVQLKIKIISWNMHDSLPKVSCWHFHRQFYRLESLQGNIAELLGYVPPYTPPLETTRGIPYFEPGSDHPYHLIVVSV